MRTFLQCRCGQLGLDVNLPNYYTPRQASGKEASGLEYLMHTLSTWESLCFLDDLSGPVAFLRKTGVEYRELEGSGIRVKR